MTSLAVPVHVQGVDVTVKTTTTWRVEGPTEEKTTELVHMVPDGADEFSFMLPAMRLIELQWTLLRIMREGHVGTPIVSYSTRPSGESMTVIFTNFRWPTKDRVKAPTEEMTELIAGGLTQIEESWDQELEPKISAVVPPFDFSKIRVEMRSAVERVEMSSFGEANTRVPSFHDEEITVTYQDNGVTLMGRYRVSPLMLTDTRLPIEDILRLLTNDLQKKWNERFGLTQDEVLAAGILNKGGLMVNPNGGDISVMSSSGYSELELENAYQAPGRDKFHRVKKEKSPLPKWNEIEARVKVENAEITVAEMNQQMTAIESKTQETIKAIQNMGKSIKWTARELRELIGILDDH